MQLFKDFETKMKDRDKVLDDNDAYRRKLWLENLDLINNNLSKFLEVMTELEHNINTLGMRHDELNEKVDLTNELVLEEQTEKENAKLKKRMEMKFPKFDPKLDTLELWIEKKKIDLSIELSIPPSFLSSCSQHLHIHVNKTRNLFDTFEVKLCVYFLL